METNRVIYGIEFVFGDFVVSEWGASESQAKAIAEKLKSVESFSEGPFTFRKRTRDVAPSSLLNPQRIYGPWNAGIVLDWHMLESKLIGQDEAGHSIFDNQRTAIGELVFRFKYRNDEPALGDLVKLALNLFWGKFDLLIPMPPSNPGRTVTKRIALGLSRGLDAPFSDTAIAKIKSTPQLKNVSDPETKRRMLDGVFSVDAAQVDGKRVLLVDDLYDSGATLEAATEALKAHAKPISINVIAMTRTRR